MDRELPSLSEIVAGSYSVTGLENKLPYLSACIKESFRLTPIFGMPLPRRVEVPGGMEIAGEHIPRGVSHKPNLTQWIVCEVLTCCMIGQCFHVNPLGPS